MHAFELVVAASAVVSALAAVAVTYYTRSSKKLFEIEHARDQAAERQVAARLARNLVRLSRSTFWFSSSRDWDPSMIRNSQLVEHHTHVVKQIHRELRRTFDEAGSQLPALVGYLHHALLSLDLAIDLLAGAPAEGPLRGAYDKHGVVEQLMESGGALLLGFREASLDQLLLGNMADVVATFDEAAEKLRVADPPPVQRQRSLLRFAWRSAAEKLK